MSEYLLVLARVGSERQEAHAIMGDNVEDSAVNDFLLILEEHRKNCERQGKYVEAEIAKNRLEELKVHEENRRKEAMRSRQIAERLGVEEAHMLEFQQFNSVWDRKMEEYERNIEELIINMRVRLGVVRDVVGARLVDVCFSTSL